GPAHDERRELHHPLRPRRPAGRDGLLRPRRGARDARRRARRLPDQVRRARRAGRAGVVRPRRPAGPAQERVRQHALPGRPPRPGERGQLPRPRRSADGLFKVQKLNDRGLVVEMAFTEEATGRPAVGPLGFARGLMRYDDRGNQVEYELSGPDGRPVYPLLGPEGKPVPGKEGFSRMTQRYDARGRLTGATGYTPDGPVRLTNDARGRVASAEYLTADGRPRV